MNINIKDTDAPEYIDRVRALIGDKGLYCHVITFGCQQNEADSERIRGMAREMGYQISDTYENADLIIVNTCAIREHAEKKALSLLGNFKSRKRENPDLIVGVCGCMANEPHVAEKIKTDFHYVSFTLEPNMLHLVPSLVYKSMDVKKRSFIYDEDVGDVVEGMPTVRSSGHRAWVSIMYGCNNFCSYCIVPYVRGRERSRESSMILKECRELISDGVKEITLLGQNVNSYRSDMDFADLLEAIANIDGDFLVRFMTSHPKDVSDKLIEVMGKHTDKIAPYFHLPLQSGSNAILKRMNRTYTREKFLATVEKLRSAVPNMALSTDVIIGFPGEREEDFLDTMDILARVRFDVVYSFNYSARVGTPAAKMSDKVDDSDKARRMSELLKLQDVISYEKNQPLLDTIQRVLVDSYGTKDGRLTLNARTNTNKLVHFAADSELVGKFVNVKITKANGFDLIAELI